MSVIVAGLSPRVRGNLVAFRPSGHLDGRFSGLSPRVRGNPPLQSIPARAGEPIQRGSIPARAGEFFVSGSIWHVGVYPRACGGTSEQTVDSLLIKVYPRACGGTAWLDTWGLSPRVRGNPLMSLNVWFVSRRDSFRGYVKDCFRRAVMRRLPVPDRDG